MHEGLPVLKKLNPQISLINPICRRCNLSEETVFHCLWECPDALETWRIAGLLFPNHSEKPWKWWLKLEEELRRNEDTKKIREIAANVIWQLWKARNGFIFKGRRSPPSRFWQQL
ncbi:uncharacterized protein DS421_4g116290 [Arachis hypogaea]|nr:uncharacterized protein DS421_4g116290 [Arachis hypogaea]